MSDELCRWLCRFGWFGYLILAFFVLNYAKFQPNGDWNLYRQTVDVIFGCFLLLSFVPAVGIGKSLREKFLSMAKAFFRSMLVMLIVLWIAAMGVAIIRP